MAEPEPAALPLGDAPARLPEQPKEARSTSTHVEVKCPRQLARTAEEPRAREGTLDAMTSALVHVPKLDTPLDVYRAPADALEAIMIRGAAPPFDDLLGWEFDGWNVGLVAGGFGLNRKFRKGFYEGPARSAAGPTPFIQGYNIPIHQDGPDRPHRAKPSDEQPKRFGFYRVYAAKENPRFHRYEGALLLDYGLGGNGFSPPALLRDYLAQVHPGSSELLLGKAYVALGPFSFVGGFFVLHRARKHEFKG